MESCVRSSLPILSVRDLGFTYREAARPALGGITFGLEAGELLVVMGASGAGKSTLCRCFNGIIPNFLKGDLQGEVRLLGEQVSRMRVAEAARTTGLVFQDFESQLFATSVELEVAFGAESQGVPREEILRRVKELLALVGLSDLRRRRPATLSGGEKQRLAIAASLSAAPALLVLDEATSDLDPVGKAAVFALARRLTSAEGARRAVVFAHHDAEEAVEASRVLVLGEGRPMALGSPAEVLADPAMLSEQGIMPLATAAVCSALGIEERPLEVEGAAELLLSRGLHLAREAGRAWEERDRARADKPGEPIVEVRGLTHCYEGGEPVLHGIDLAIRRGEFVAIIGQNGSGKSTLVKHFNGLLRPTQGGVRVGGEKANSLPLSALGQRVGHVFQNPDHQIFAPTVAEEVAFAPRNFGVEGEEVEARVAEALSAVGLAGREDEDPFALTKGERQRVAVASVLAGRPEVLIFDEPTTGLDARECRGIMSLIERLNRQGHTIIVVTHAMWLVAEYADRVVVMQGGRVVLDAPTRRAFAEEEALRGASIIPPQIVRLSRRLGGTALRVAELVEALRRG